MMLIIKMLIWLNDFCWQTEKPLERFENRQFYKVTTTDDPVIRCAPAEPIQSDLFFTRLSPGIYNISHLCINWSLIPEGTHLSMFSICLWFFYYNSFTLWSLAFVKCHSQFFCFCFWNQMLIAEWLWNGTGDCCWRMRMLVRCLLRMLFYPLSCAHLDLCTHGILLFNAWATSCSLTSVMLHLTFSQ